MNQEQSNQLTVHLRWYRGTSVSYDANGKPTTENNLVKLSYGSPEYYRFLDNLLVNGCCKAVVEKVLQHDNADRKKVTEVDTEKFNEEVQERFNGGKREELTPDQKRIADLESKIEALTSQLGGNKQGNSSKETTTGNAGDELAAARQEYMELTGEQGDKRWTAETIRKKIEELKNNAE